MKRREAIRNVIIVSAGAAFLYSCKEKPATMTLKHIPLTSADEELMSVLTETILPGANELSSGAFVLMMSDDCLSPERQEKFANGMKEFNKAGFVKMSDSEKKDYISKLQGDAKDFFELVKEGTIRNLTTSEAYLRDVRGITTLIPPKFQACVSVSNA